MKLTFLGAANTVTGSKTLVETDSTRILIDCGLYQGVKSRRNRNWQALDIDPESLDAVLLTHAHIDHSGMLPVLCRDGFDGPIFASASTLDLCRILLPDAAHIQEEDASYANRKGFSKHHPALPLYTREDADQALDQIVPVPFDEKRKVGDVTFRMQRAGHILGAASIQVEGEGRSVLFSGDLGRRDDLLTLPPSTPKAPDFIVVESTYGDRLHDATSPIEVLARILRETLDRSGILLIPSFAVGRTQTLLYCLHEIFRSGLAPRVPVYVNSPMATRVTDLFRISSKEHRLSADESAEVCEIARFVQSVEESRKLAERREPMVIISASGMCESGRVLHHLRHSVSNIEDTIVMIGFQAEHTLGRRLVERRPTVRFLEQDYPLSANVEVLNGLSAHADALDFRWWFESMHATSHIGQAFIVHGECAAAEAQAQTLDEFCDEAPVIPEPGVTYEV